MRWRSVDAETNVEHVRWSARVPVCHPYFFLWRFYRLLVCLHNLDFSLFVEVEEQHFLKPFWHHSERFWIRINSIMRMCDDQTDLDSCLLTEHTFYGDVVIAKMDAVLLTCHSIQTLSWWSFLPLSLFPVLYMNDFFPLFWVNDFFVTVIIEIP